MASKKKTKFVCIHCGYESPKWMGKCPGCSAWNSMEEEVEQKSISPLPALQVSSPLPIVDVELDKQPRFDTYHGELNRVLGGGLVPGSLVLVGGDPGIGKSTLLLQLSHRLCEAGQRVLYVSGEESATQTRLRAERLGALSPFLYVLTETEISSILRAAEELSPALMVVDSIQTMYDAALSSVSGSVSQIRQCTQHLLTYAKKKGVATIIVGHVTKDGELAGPRLLEHMVDAVLYFEGDRHHTYRILRSVKNRFGSTLEMGIFEMTEKGLREVKNASSLFLTERERQAEGSAVVACMEGSRPVLVEVQGLVVPSSFPSPRRMATGLDYNRVMLLIAVLEKRVGLLLQNQDAYVNVVGGVRVGEPAVDLGIAVALASSFRERATEQGDVFIGEVGLTGEIRGVSRVEQRINEARKLGFRRVILPHKNAAHLHSPSDLELVGVKTLEEALHIALGG